MRFFDLHGSFQNGLDRWVREIEHGGGCLEIVAEEPVVWNGSTKAFVLCYRIGPSYDDEMPKVEPGAERMKQFVVAEVMPRQVGADSCSVTRSRPSSTRGRRSTCGQGTPLV